MSEEAKLIKNKECISCDKFFDCKGKPRKVERCVNYVERKKDGGAKNVH